MAYPTVINDTDLMGLTLLSGYVSGTSLVLNTGGGTTISNALTAESQPAISATNPLPVSVEEGSTRMHFSATGLTGDTLTVSTVQGTPPGGGFTTAAKVKVGWTSQLIRSLQAATVSGGTSGRLPYETTDGLLTDSPKLTFDGTTVLIQNGVSDVWTALLELKSNGAGVTTTFNQGPEFQFLCGGNQMGLSSANSAVGPIKFYLDYTTPFAYRQFVNTYDAASSAIALGGVASQSAPLMLLQQTTTVAPAVQTVAKIDGAFNVSANATYQGDLVFSTVCFNATHEAMRFHDMATFTQAVIPIGNVRTAVDDAAAAALTPAVPVGGIYRNGSVLMIRVS